MRDLATSLILYEKITTTEAKAKTLRPFVERLITTSKANTLQARRRLNAVLLHEKAVAKALEVVGPRYQSRAGGYTRIIHLKPRLGDGAKQAVIELV